MILLAQHACFAAITKPLAFYGDDTGKLKVRDGTAEATFHIKGVSWFGFETETACVHELWKHSAQSYVNFLVRCVPHTRS